jgi:DNA-dependent protein kinase catalytic subunit
MCAESILSAVNVLDAAIFIKSKPFVDMLSHLGSAQQLVCLKMLYGLIEKHENEDLFDDIFTERIIQLVCSFAEHTSVSCRLQMLLILISLYKHYDTKLLSNKESSDPIGIRARQMSGETLLRALVDDDEAIRVMAQNFWTEKWQNDASTVDRMVHILNNMYSTKTEAYYLSYATNLLLEKTSKSPDYNRYIYENPLSQCQFREYNVSVDWRRRHEMMTPLFVDTLASAGASSQQQRQSHSLDNSLSSFDPSGGNSNNWPALRATQQQQSLQFQPTQEQSKLKAYNWLTQSSIDTFQASLMLGTLGDSTQSALLFNQSKSRPIYKTNGTAAVGQKQPQALAELDEDVLRLRRRFRKDRSVAEMSRFFARKNVSFVFS